MIKAVLSKDTLIPLGFVFVLVAGVIAVNNRLMKIEFRLSNIESTVAKATDDRWRSADMRSWVRLFAAQNPELNVPEAERITPGE